MSNPVAFVHSPLLDDRGNQLLARVVSENPQIREGIAHARRERDFVGWFAGLPETQELAAMLEREDEFIPKKGASK